jgi:hypothetical protein
VVSNSGTPISSEFSQASWSIVARLISHSGTLAETTTTMLPSRRTTSPTRSTEGTYSSLTYKLP